jgi:hypothetical protein
LASTALIRLGSLAAMVEGLAAATLGLLYVLQARGSTLGPIGKALQKGHTDFHRTGVANPLWLREMDHNRYPRT